MTYQQLVSEDRCTISALRKQGFKNAAIAFQYPGGSGFLWKNTLTLSGSRRHGTFTGWTAPTPRYVTGSFSC